MTNHLLMVDTDESILAEFRSGSRERAATAFVQRHQRFVMSVAMRNTNTIDDARDAAQEVFIRALKNIDGFKGDAQLTTWLYRITMNVCISMRRKKRMMSFFAFGEAEGERDVRDDHQVLPDQRASSAQFQVYLDGILATLPPKQRETFSLRYFDELSYEEISEMVGTSVGALKANYHWAVKKIADHLRTSEYYEQWMEGNRER
jgi:RNA polymerase sigma factor (sigma-70 family)